ncbi:ABC transporter ATP-binding protein [Sinomonas cellulolyticus]|uniref:ABC-F family ATP-binding cassette domain-containing protein n=1 Tax=Sinomonas cellulolyticus TaxID=2801916 RepID=A0ABS1K242_9MICC|nr:MULTISPECIES: ATP-binding cassette domain-containing protein [Sinomonas]MBL0705749.1 ABC-F family ATP-binding cassette domain-containing protein [Sinomonas cellulolyticus]GHG52252.1 ABC transporter ATP-binding protein [Sinomonas sp. KCTC 49339]
MPAPLNRFHASRPELRDGAPRRESVHITASEVSHGYGDRLLLDRISLVISEGERIAVVGENGAGKSTLLRLLAGGEQPESGTVAVHGRVSRLAQTYDGATTVGGMLTAGAERIAAALAAERGESRPEDADPDEAGSGVVRAEVAAAIAVERLGVGHLVRGGRDRVLADLSGGEAERIALALALADPAPILLLDEPTNHLDAEALAWLEAELAARPGIVVAVSHDRDFLERFARVILEVDADTRTVRRYGSGYAGYRAEKARERRDWERRYAAWIGAKDRERAKARDVAERVAYGRRTDNDKSGYNYLGQRVSAAVESQIRSARERLRRLEADPVLPPPRPLHLAAAFEVDAGAAVALSATAVPGRLAPVDASLAPGDRLLVTGPNGAGKSTLVGVLAGTVAFTGSADVTAAHDGGRRAAVVGLLPQELAAPADPSVRLLAAYAHGLPGDLDSHAEALMHTGLFRVQDFFVPVGSLSAGQYRRLALARLLAGRPELLLLDEPTNHLAPLLVGELEQALEHYRGTLVVASHDRALARWFDRLGAAGDRRLALQPVASGGRLHTHH